MIIIHELAAPGQRCLAERGMRVKQVHEQHTCSARGGGYTIRTLRVLGASVAASASYTIRTLGVLSASAAASYTVCTLRVLRAALLRSEHTDNHTDKHTSQVPLISIILLYNLKFNSVQKAICCSMLKAPGTNNQT